MTSETLARCVGMGKFDFVVSPRAHLQPTGLPVQAVGAVCLMALMVPTLRVGTPPGALCVPQTRSVCGCVPTQSVGTIRIWTTCYAAARESLDSPKVESHQGAVE